MSSAATGPRECAHCGVEKDEDEFYVKLRSSTGTVLQRDSRCRSCVSAYYKQCRTSNGSRLKGWRRKKRDYGRQHRRIELLQFEEKVDNFINSLREAGYEILERRKTRKTERFSGGKTYRIYTRDPAGDTVVFKTARKGSTWYRDSADQTAIKVNANGARNGPTPRQRD